MITLYFRFTLVSALFGCAAIWASQAAAFDRPMLRAEVAVGGSIVTIGDFFANSGSLAGVPLFRSPDLGEVGSIETWRVIDAARQAGLRGEDANGITEVTVTRRAITVQGGDIKTAIAEEMARRVQAASIETISVNFNELPNTVKADANAVEPVKLAGLRWSRRSGRFNAIVIIDQGDVKKPIRLSGTAREMVKIVMLSRSYDRNEIVSRDDIVIDYVPRDQNSYRAINDPEIVAGKAAIRNVAGHRPLNPDDFAEPRLVRRGETVTIFFEIPGLTLTARGRALESGVDGDMINVVNSQSKRIVRSRIIGRGKVSVARPKASFTKLSEVRK